MHRRQLLRISAGAFYASLGLPVLPVSATTIQSISYHWVQRGFAAVQEKPTSNGTSLMVCLVADCKTSKAAKSLFQNRLDVFHVSEDASRKRDFGDETVLGTSRDLPAGTCLLFVQSGRFFHQWLTMADSMPTDPYSDLTRTAKIVFTSRKKDKPRELSGYLPSQREVPSPLVFTGEQEHGATD